MLRDFRLPCFFCSIKSLTAISWEFVLERKDSFLFFWHSRLPLPGNTYVYVVCCVGSTTGWALALQELPKGRLDLLFPKLLAHPSRACGGSSLCVGQAPPTGGLCWPSTGGLYCRAVWGKKGGLFQRTGAPGSPRTPCRKLYSRLMVRWATNPFNQYINKHYRYPTLASSFQTQPSFSKHGNFFFKAGFIQVLLCAMQNCVGRPAFWSKGV